MNKKRVRYLVNLLLLCLGVLLASNRAESSAAAPLLQANLLQNPSFEEPYSSGAAQGWGRWHQELNSDPKPSNCRETYLVRPKWSGEMNGSIIVDGARSQHVGNQFDTWRGGVMQTVSVTPGSTYRLTFSGTGRASNDQYPAPSDGSVNMRVRGGMDPNGSGQWSDSDIVWGAEGSPHMGGSSGNWQQFSVETTATGNQITVFLQANFGGADQCRAHLDVWFDVAQLVEVGPPPTNTPPPPPPPPPAPVATNTPVPPTATATSEAPPEDTPVSTDTPEPADTPTSAPEPSQGGVICVNAFADSNANGQRDPDEGYMAGVSLNVVQSEVVVAQGVSTGTEIPLCFEEMSAGSYVVGQVVPRNLEMTTAPSANIDVTQGSTISLEFGSRFKPDSGSDEVASAVTPTSEGQAPSDQGGASAGRDGGVSMLAIIGLGAILLAIVLLGLLIYLLLRQQRA